MNITIIPIGKTQPDLSGRMRAWILIGDDEPAVARGGEAGRNDGLDPLETPHRPAIAPTIFNNDRPLYPN